MKIPSLVVVLAFAVLSSLPVAAQTTTGSNTSITLPTPPRTMASMPVASTPGVDSTFQGNVVPNQQATYSITMPWTYSGTSSSTASPAAVTKASALSRPEPAPHATSTPASSSTQIY